MLSQEWIQLDAVCETGSCESLGALLMGQGALGTQEVEVSSGESKLTAYFEAPLPQDLQEEVEATLVQFRCEQVVWTIHKDDGWSTRWQEHFKPLEIGERLVVCPSWETYETKPSQKMLRLDPGMAFGTGQHATTRGSLLLMERYLPAKVSVLDVGCGSGILSLGALLLGASYAVGVDIDADSIVIAKENAVLNQLAECVDFSTTSIDDVPGRYPFVLANIQAHILIPMVSALVQRVQPGGMLILSGIIDTKRDRLVSVYKEMGCVLKDEVAEEGWHSLAFETT